MDTQLGRVEHLDTEDVVLAAVPGAKRFSHCGDAYAQQTSVLSRFFLLLQEVLVSDRFQPYFKTLAVLAGISEETERCSVGKVVVLYEVEAANLRLVDSEIFGCSLNHSFLEEHCLGDTEGAAIGDTTRRLVGINAACREVCHRDVVASEGCVHQADLELAWLGVGEKGSVIGVCVHAHTKYLPVISQSHLPAQIDVATEACRDEVACLVLYPLHRAFEQD